MSEEKWHQARLIPTSGINGADEQERRATSALLAVMGIVSQFTNSLLKPLGAPSGHLETFIEVPFDLGGKRLYPDGLIRVCRGAKTWTALVEVKTGKNELQTDQLESYLDIAKDEGFDALITISNEIPPGLGQHPTKVDKNKLRKVDLHHWSWALLLSTAVIQKEHRGVSDPEQAWILGELIRYLEHPKSGALELDDMGSSWVSLRESVTSGTLRPNDKTIDEITSRFDALLRFISLRLGRQLGADVSPVLSRKEAADPKARSQSLAESLVKEGRLYGSLRIPNAAGVITIIADLRANQVSCHVDIEAPKEGRSTTRINWLLRQLKSASDTTRIECFAAHSRGPGAADLLGNIRLNPKVLILDPTKDLRTFRIAHSASMGAKRGRGRGSFIDSVIDIVDGFYGDVVQQLKPWAAAPPKLRDQEQPEPTPLASNAYSSQDRPETEGPLDTVTESVSA